MQKVHGPPPDKHIQKLFQLKRVKISNENDAWKSTRNTCQPFKCTLFTSPNTRLRVFSPCSKPIVTSPKLWKFQFTHKLHLVRENARPDRFRLRVSNSGCIGKQKYFPFNQLTIANACLLLHKDFVTHNRMHQQSSKQYFDEKKARDSLFQKFYANARSSGGRPHRQFCVCNPSHSRRVILFMTNITQRGEVRAVRAYKFRPQYKRGKKLYKLLLRNSPKAIVKFVNEHS